MEQKADRAPDSDALIRLPEDSQPLHGIFHALTQPGMSRLFLAQFLINGQLFLAFSTLPLYTEQLGGTAWTTGLHTAIFTGVGMLLRFFLGPLADTHGRKLPLLLGAFVYASTNGLLLLADNLVLLGLVRGYQGIGLAAYPSASTALVLDLSPPAFRGVALSLNRAMSALALLVFPIGAQQLLDHWGYPALFLAGAAFSTLAFFLLLSLREAAPSAAGRWVTPVSAAGRSADAPRTNFSPTRVLSAFVEVGRQPAVPAVLAAVAVTAVTYVGATSFLPLWIQAQGSGDYGPFFLALGSGAFLAGFAGGFVDRRGARTTLLVALAAAAAGAACLAWRTTGPVLLLSGALVGSGYTLSMTAAPTWIDQLVPTHRRATAMALTETGLDTGLSIGFPLLGALAATLGYGSVFVTLAVMGLAALLMVARQK